MSIKNLKTLVCIAEKGSFSSASEDMYISQAAVSLQMKALEEELKIELFDRTKRPPVLNEKGWEIIPKAKKIISYYEDLIKNNIQNEHCSGHLLLGSIHTMLIDILPTSLSGLQKSVPELHISVTSGLSSTLLIQVEKGLIDAAIISEPTSKPPGLRWHPIILEKFSIIAPSNTSHMPAKQLLETHNFIRFNKNAWVGQIINNYLSNNNIKVKDAMELNTLESISAMVSKGLGISIIPSISIPEHIKEKIRIIELEDTPVYRCVGIIEQEQSKKSNLTQQLLKELKITINNKDYKK